MIKEAARYGRLGLGVPNAALRNMRVLKQQLPKIQRRHNQFFRRLNSRTFVYNQSPDWSDYIDALRQYSRTSILHPVAKVKQLIRMRDALKGHDDLSKFTQLKHIRNIAKRIKKTPQFVTDVQDFYYNTILMSGIRQRKMLFNTFMKNPQLAIRLAQKYSLLHDNTYRYSPQPTDKFLDNLRTQYKLGTPWRRLNIDKIFQPGRIYGAKNKVGIESLLQGDDIWYTPHRDVLQGYLNSKTIGDSRSYIVSVDPDSKLVKGHSSTGDVLFTKHIASEIYDPRIVKAIQENTQYNRHAGNAEWGQRPDYQAVAYIQPYRDAYQSKHTAFIGKDDPVRVYKYLKSNPNTKQVVEYKHGRNRYNLSSLQ